MPDAENSQGRSGPTRLSLLSRLGGLVARRTVFTLVSTLVVTVAVAALAAGALGSMVLSRWEAPGTESVRAQTALIEQYGTGNPNLILLVGAQRGTVDSAEVAAAGRALARQLAAEDAVGAVWSYWSQDRDPTLRSDDGRQALVLAWVEGDATQARAVIGERLLPRYTVENATITAQVAGSEAASSQTSELAAQDFLRAEIIIIPLMLILLVIVYRRVSPALLTLAVGLFSVLSTMAALRGSPRSPRSRPSRPTSPSSWGSGSASTTACSSSPVSARNSLKGPPCTTRWCAPYGPPAARLSSAG